VCVQDTPVFEVHELMLAAALDAGDSRAAE
jgi:hypothetical protein